MKNIVIVGGSKGIGRSAILLQQLEKLFYNISRNADITHPNLKHFPLDILQDALPEM
jgi:hypothetical protein